MTFSFLVLNILKYLVLTHSTDKIEKFNISGICGFPGEPISAQHNIEDKVIFSEGDIITYQCVDFLSYKHERRCHNGKWIGPQARCGHGINNDINRVVIKDCITNEIISDYNPIKLDKNNDRFTNSFSSDRYNEMPIRVSNSTCFRWHLHLNEKSHFSFVRIDFAIVFESVTKANKEAFIVSASVDRYNQQNLCQIEAQKKYKHIWTNKWINYGHKYHYYFNCHKPEHNEKQLPQIFIIETASRIPLTIDLARFAIADVYGSVDDPACGVPEIPIGVNARPIKYQQMYELYCNELNFINTTQTSLTHIRCSSDALWTGEYPKCKPIKSCDNSKTIKNLGNTLIDSIENVYFYNESFWYAIDGSLINYNCSQYYNNMFGSKTRKCLSNGFWDSKKAPICKSNELDLSLASTGKESIKLIYFLPFYIIAGITSLMLIIIAIIALIFVKKRENHKDYNDPNGTQCPSIAPASCVTDITDLEDNESVFQFQYQYQNEPIYDFPPNNLRPVEVLHDIKVDNNRVSDPIYDAPKTRQFN